MNLKAFMHSVMQTAPSPALSQSELEDATVYVGAQRYHEEQARVEQREGMDKRDAVVRLLRVAAPTLSAAITDWLISAGGKVGVKPSGFEELSLIDPDKLAYLTLVRVLRALPAGGAVNDIVTDVGRAVEIELEAQALEEANLKVLARIKKLAAAGVSENYLLDQHTEAVRDTGIELGWSHPQRGKVGTALLRRVLLSLRDIFDSKTQKRGTETGGEVFVTLTDEAAAALNGLTEALAFARPPFQPMIVPPRPWTALHSGCYHDVRLSKLVPLVRTFSAEHKRHLKAAIADGSMQEVLDAVNAIQETRWAIDTRVLRLVRWAKERALRPSRSFPASELPAVPTKFASEEWEAMDSAKRSALSRARKVIKDFRASAAVENALFIGDLELADLLSEHGAFYLPHSLDFRGRVYAVPHFNHQRSDHLKALFRFADAVPLGPDGGDWLMIHLANCGDFKLPDGSSAKKASKGTFQERIAWVRANELDILMCARDPEGTYGYWSQADSPFCFLQACFEYDEWMRSGFSPDYASSIAIAADGSCSGLQHYSAITRSAEEAHHVNLTPRDTVGDIYQVVADEAVPRLQELSADALSSKGRVASIVLANGFGRSEVKRNVMTYFYGSARFGMRDQHLEDTMRPIADKAAMGELPKHPYAILAERENKDTGEKSLMLDGGYSCAHLMANATFDAVVSVAPKADEAATWIQGLAATLAHEDHSMVWRTPIGFPVVQRYTVKKTDRVKIHLYSRSLELPTKDDKVTADGDVEKRRTISLQTGVEKSMEKKRMRSASSPNVIHSMDGAHLQRSVAMAHAEGIRHFAMIHDSFGTHAGNMGAFSRIIREAFISCYESYCPLEELDRYARSVLTDDGIEKLKPLPAKGDLDLNLLRESLYAFA